MGGNWAARDAANQDMRGNWAARGEANWGTGGHWAARGEANWGTSGHWAARVKPTGVRVATGLLGVKPTEEDGSWMPCFAVGS